jgi:hypothetical protein
MRIDYTLTIDACQQNDYNSVENLIGKFMIYSIRQNTLKGQNGE